MRMTIGKKLISGFLMVAALVLISGILGIFSVDRVGKSTDVILEEEMPLADASMEMKIALITSRDLTGEYLSKEKVEELPQVEKEFDGAFEGYTGWVKKIEAMDLSSEERGIIESLDKKDDTYIANAKSMMGNHRKSREYYDESKAQMVQFDNARNEVMDDLVKLEEIQDKEFEDAGIRADKMAESPDSTKTQIMELLDEVLDTHVKAADAGMEMKTSVVLQGDSCGEYLLEEDPSKLSDIEKDIRSSINEFDKWEGALEKIDVGADVKKFMGEIVGDHNELEKTQDKMLLAHRNYIECKALARVDMGKLDSISASMEEDLTKLEEISGQGMDNAMATADRTQNTSSILLIALTVIAVILAIVIGIIISRGITRPIRTVMDISNRIAVEGDLSKMVDVKGMKIAEEEEEEEEEEEAKTKDEIVLLAISFNRLIRSMRSLAEQAKTIANDDLMNKVLEKKIKGDLGDSFTTMIGNLRNLADQAQTIANDDLSNPKLITEGRGSLGSATATMVRKLKDLAEQAESISKDELQNAILKTESAGVLGSAFAKMVIFLRDIAAKAQAVAKGDLTVDVKVIGVLSGAFQEMITSLRQIIIEVRKTAEKVSSSSQQLSSGAQQMNATAQEVSSTVQQIAKGTESQAQKVEETSKVMEQMNASVNQVAISSQTAASASVQASQSAQKGGEAAKEAVKKMDKIYETVTQSATVVKKLGERSEQITDIVGVITDIADQTNLLALNAAIEAARAGEAGRGFAVVAEEVRKLAEGSAKAADEITKLIKDVQKETTQAVGSMEQGSKEVSEGREVITKAGIALEEIIKTVQNTASMVQQISAGAQQMAAGTKQVVKSVDDIATTAEESASATEEAGASTEEMTASMEEMAASAQELAQMAIDLREVVDKFKTGEALSPVLRTPSPQRVEGKVPKAPIAQKLAADRKKLEELRKRPEPPK